MGFSVFLGFFLVLKQGSSKALIPKLMFKGCAGEIFPFFFFFFQKTTCVSADK